jgi:hypothetical protein
MSLTIKPKSECTFDQISMGEVMLRLDPGEGRIRTARQFAAWEGGGEYNTSRGLKKCFGYKTAVVPPVRPNGSFRNLPQKANSCYEVGQGLMWKLCVFSGFSRLA